MKCTMTFGKSAPLVYQPFMSSEKEKKASETKNCLERPAGLSPGEGSPLACRKEKA